MKNKLLLPVIFTAMLSSACVTSMNSTPRLDLWGDPAPVSAAQRTILITADTKYVNITGGETVKFVAGDKSFAWNFDGITEGYVFDLNQAAPPGVLDHRVIAYVDPNPKYPNGR